MPCNLKRHISSELSLADSPDKGVQDLTFVPSLTSISCPVLGCWQLPWNVTVLRQPAALHSRGEQRKEDTVATSA